jgi:LPXTG-motif cell wall-anchored protein
VACTVAFVVGVAPFHAQADQWDKTTILTVDQTIQVSKTVLQPGQYVFKLLDSPADRHVVQIFNRDRTHIIDTVIAIPNYRLQPTGHSRFAFWETPPGYAKALRAWFYPGDNFGQEFVYPKQLAMLETASTAATTTTASAETPAPAEPAPAPAEEPSAERSAEAATEEQPVETAQNTPPPAEPEPQPAAQEPAPTTLPKTGSPYPLFGFGGLAALALCGLLRLKRAA